MFILSGESTNQNFQKKVALNTYIHTYCPLLTRKNHKELKSSGYWTEAIKGGERKGWRNTHSPPKKNPGKWKALYNRVGRKIHSFAYKLQRQVLHNNNTRRAQYGNENADTKEKYGSLVFASLGWVPPPPLTYLLVVLKSGGGEKTLTKNKTKKISRCKDQDFKITILYIFSKRLKLRSKHTLPLSWASHWVLLRIDTTKKHTHTHTHTHTHEREGGACQKKKKKKKKKVMVAVAVAGWLPEYRGRNPKVG